MFLCTSCFYAFVKYPKYIWYEKASGAIIQASYENYGIKILDILSKQNNKQELIQQVINNRFSRNNDHEWTILFNRLDLWLLCDFYKLPVLLISDDSLETLHLNVPWLVMGGNKDVDVYYCVRSFNESQMPGYKMINYGLGLGKMENFRTLLDDPEYAGHALTINSYLETYSVM